ncbi:MAG TPA: hypothetical protein VFJ90_07865, partial [Candidatus Didemnitutus sp.]|nr:hypothetical protein [Candidatus Didemnitutus sp.]
AKYSFANVRPDVVVPADSPQTALRVVNRLNVQMLTPPAELQWKLEGIEREFAFDYGYDPAVFTQGEGDGTDFILEVREPNKAPREIFRERLDPAHRPADRELHSARVTLPPVNAGSRLVLRTDPGKAGDGSWDWSFVTNFELRRATYAPERFPGFNRVPTFGDTGNASIVDSPYGRIVQLHAPSALTYQLAGNETRLRFDYGILPGAYTGEGATDGAVFLVELHRPNQPVETLLRRPLEPRRREGDRGLQHADLPLNKLGPADRLIVTIDPGPARSNAWDWTYITHFELQ